MGEYIVPSGYGEDQFIEKRSRFIGHVWHVDSEAEAIARIKAAREKYWDASHNVYAYGLRNGNIARYSDDGEPSGTGGMPVLNVFRSAGVEDFCCVVTRYFGGILLGAGGLVRAYTKGAVIALAAAGRSRMQRMLTLSLVCSYSQYERIRPELGRFDASVLDTVYGADVNLTISITPEGAERFVPRVTELTAGTAAIEVTGEDMCPVRITE